MGQYFTCTQTVAFDWDAAVAYSEGLYSWEAFTTPEPLKETDAPTPLYSFLLLSHHTPYIFVSSLLVLLGMLRLLR